jgi:hypothetical protein
LAISCKSGGAAGLTHNDTGAGVLVTVEVGTGEGMDISVDATGGVAGRQAPSMDAATIKRKVLFT